ncbi:MAG: sulfatase-like hydrolase/transferase [Chitinophagaceae bacterium]
MAFNGGREHKSNKAVFLYTAYTARHIGQCKRRKGQLEKYKGKFEAGWDVLRAERLKKEKQLGVIDKDINLSPLDTHTWAEEKDKPAMKRRMETYAAMITIMDEGIGKIVSELKKEGIYNNTIILFLHDNGGNAEGVGFGGPNGETRPAAKDTSALKLLGKKA